MAAWLVAVCGCQGVAAELGDSPADASRNADLLLYSLGQRFGPITTVAEYDRIRRQIAGSALVPSVLFNDSTIWNRSTEGRRELQYVGTAVPEGYLLGQQGIAGDPYRPGEYRRTTVLRQVGDDQFRWSIRDELVIGSISPAELGDGLRVLLTAGGQVGSDRATSSIRSELPYSGRILDPLIDLDPLRLPEGSSDALSVEFDVNPDGLRRSRPALARYLDRYLSPLRLNARIVDYDGSAWGSVVTDDGRTELTVGVRDGEFAPLGAPAPAMRPDSLRVLLDVDTKLGIFGVGADEVVADLVFEGGDAPRVTAHFRNEPDWNLPLMVESILDAPLGRPFAGEGSSLSFSLQELPGRTLVIREYDIVVQESRIMRWLGALGSRAYSDFREGAEAEFEDMIGDLFVALRRDVSQLLN